MKANPIPGMPERCRPLLCLTCLLALLAAGACGRADPTSTQPAQASPAGGASAAPTEVPLGAVKPPNLTETALAPTQPIVTPAPSPTPSRPPTPAVPLDQALREFPRDALLELTDEGELILTGSTGAHQLWLSGPPCLTDSVPSPWGAWSADGRLLVVVCSTERDNGRGYTIRQATLYDLRTGAVTGLASGQAAAPLWAPVGSRMLMNVREASVEGVAGGERLAAATLLIDGETGAKVRLPITAAWASSGYYRLGAEARRALAVPRGDPTSAAAWSPDGSRIALVRLESEGGGLYVLDGDGSDPRRLESIEATPAYVGLKDLVGWSADGRWIVIVRLARTRGPKTNPDPQRVWVSPDTGEVRVDDPARSGRRSPEAWAG